MEEMENTILERVLDIETPTSKIAKSMMSTRRINWDDNPNYLASTLGRRKARNYPELGLSATLPIYESFRIHPESVQWVTDPGEAGEPSLCLLSLLRRFRDQPQSLPFWIIAHLARSVELHRCSVFRCIFRPVWQVSVIRIAGSGKTNPSSTDLS